MFSAAWLISLKFIQISIKGADILQLNRSTSKNRVERFQHRRQLRHDANVSFIAEGHDSIGHTRQAWPCMSTRRGYGGTREIYSHLSCLNLFPVDRPSFFCSQPTSCSNGNRQASKPALHPSSTMQYAWQDGHKGYIKALLDYSLSSGSSLY